tara:strand:- start:643 stop:822 length:180 start_codon:yes stop_codon:yes gene_type:complete
LEALNSPAFAGAFNNYMYNVSEKDKALLEVYLKGKAIKMLSACGLDQLGDKIEKSLTKE